jgi:hypothetical protein
MTFIFMNLIRLARRVASVAVLLCTTQLSAVTVSELRSNPIWQPATTTLKRAVTLSGGRVFPVGYVAKVDGFEGNSVIVESHDGKSRFKMEMKDVTVLEDAKKHVDAFTPAQRKLTPASLSQNQALWPYTVTLTAPVNFGDGTGIPTGTQLVLESFNGHEVTAISHELRGKYTIPVTGTDFYASCLQAVLTPPAPRLFQEIDTYAIDAQSRQPSDLLKDGGPDFLAVYFAANWCPFSTKASPSVTALFNQLAEAGDERIKLVLISNDNTPAEFRTHLNKLAVKGYAVAPDRVNYLRLLRDLQPLRSLPTLYVVDRNGRVVISKDLPNSVLATEDVLASIKTL